MRILLIENQKTVSESIKVALSTHNYAIEVVTNSKIGEEYALLGHYDLIILESYYPEANAYNLALRIKSKQHTIPILMLTNKLDMDDRILGLNSGVDYHLVKPFDSRELLACVNALLRRPNVQINQLYFGNTSFDLYSGVLSCGEKSIRLTAKEFDVLRLLFMNPHHNISKEYVISHVWGYDSYATDNNVEVYIGFLRKKLATIDSNVSIVAVRKLGYHLEIK